MLDKEQAAFVKLNDVVEPLAVKVLPLLRIIIIKTFGFDCETIRTQAAQKYPRKSLFDVLVDYFLHASEACFRRRHESAHFVESQCLSRSPDSFYCRLVAIVKSIGPVGIVQILRPVQ